MIVDINFIGLIIASIMASAVPLILASCGELITERSGVLNLGVEGMMIIGAISVSYTHLTLPTNREV